MVILPGLSVKSAVRSGAAVEAAYAFFKKDYTVWMLDAAIDIPEGYSLRDAAKDCAETMMQLKISDAYVFGCSLGGMIAQGLAHEYPELVNRILLASSICRPNSVSIESFEIWAKYVAERNVREIYREFWRRVYSPGFVEKYKDVLTLMESDATEEDLRRMAILIDAASVFDSSDWIADIECPIMVIGSKLDKTLAAEGSTDIAELSGCSIYMYDGYSHAVYDEAPDYKDRIAAFFSK